MIRPKPERQPFDPNLGQPKKVRRPTKRQQAMRRAKQAGRQASRSPGGFAAGGTVETDAYGKYTIARGSGAARPQKFRKNG